MVRLRSSTISGQSALLGGIGWLVLVPAAELERRGVVTYDGYNRVLAVPLLLFTAALLLAPAALSVRKRLARVGLRIAAAGCALLWVGNVIEFYGVLLQDRPNAQAAHEAGMSEHWVGSDVGWILFGLGMFTLLIGGLIAAVAFLRDPARPRRLAVFAAALGVGVLAGNLFGLSSAFLSVPVLAIYAAGWLWFGRFLLKGGHSTGRIARPNTRITTRSRTRLSP